MADVATQELLQQYVEGLAELTFNSKPIITNLTIIAGEIAKAHGPVAAANVAAAIEKQIRQARPEAKLPVLYLLDSVAKNLRAVYAPLFERNLPEIYIRALEAAPSPGVRTSLEHLRATWKDVFPAAHAAIDRHLAQLAAAPPPPVAAPWQQAPPDWGAAQQQPPPWQQQAPPQAGWYGGGPPQGYGAPQQLPPPGMQFMQPQQQYAQFRPQDAYGGGYGGMAAPMMVMMAPQQGYGGGYPGAPDGGMGMYGHAPQQGGPMGFAPQQQQQMQPLGGTMQPPWMPLPGMPPPAPPPAQAPPAGGSALASLLQGLAAGIVSGKLSGAPGGGPGGPGGASLPPRPSIGTAFTAEALRAAPAASLRVLYDPEALQCAATGRRFTDRGVYSAHLDLQYLQKRREKEGKAQSRRWFVPLDAWIVGAAAPTGGDDPSPFGDAPGGGAAAEPPGPPPSVPVDEAQPACALTGESFETFWNAELEEWHYRGAVRLERPAGGVPAGRLVLAKAVPREGDAAAGAALRVAESRALAADLAAAAAAADEAALPPPYVEPVAPPAAAQVEPPPAAQAPAEPPAAAAEDVKRPLEAATDGAEDASGEPASKRQRNAE